LLRPCGVLIGLVCGDQGVRNREKNGAGSDFTPLSFAKYNQKTQTSRPPESMRLTEFQTEAIRQIASQVAGAEARVRVFGSRLDDTAKGGDLDLLLELPEAVDNPALVAARLSARVSRLMQGRKVDVVVSAPNLMHLPIHDVAFQEGKLL
jgi:predicted nucleotidyltransferase